MELLLIMRLNNKVYSRTVNAALNSVLVSTFLGISITLLTGERILAQPNTFTFTLENFTDQNLLGFFMAPSSEEDWGEDKLGEEILESEQTKDIDVTASGENCWQDILGVFEVPGQEDLEIVEELEVDVCELEDDFYTFYDQEDEAEYVEEESYADNLEGGQPQEFQITNLSNSLLVEFYATPSQNNDWGFDRLEDIIDPDAAMTVTLPLPSDSNSCPYDLSAILFSEEFSDEEEFSEEFSDEEEFSEFEVESWEVDLCQEEVTEIIVDEESIKIN